MRMHWKVRGAMVFAIIAMLSMSAVVMAAPAAKFHSVSSTVGSGGELIVNWDERGVGSGGGPIDYVLTADANATYHCRNSGGNFPNAANKTTVTGTVSATGSFAATQGGRVVASLSAGPPSAGSFTCPSGQTLVITQVSYTNIVLTDTTNNSSTNVPNASAVLIVVP